MANEPGKVEISTIQEDQPSSIEETEISNMVITEADENPQGRAE